MERGLPRQYTQKSASTTEFCFPEQYLCDSQLCDPKRDFSRNKYGDKKTPEGFN